MKVAEIIVSKRDLWRLASISAGALLLLVSLFLIVPGAFAEVHFIGCPPDTTLAGSNNTVAIPLGTVMTGSFTPETGDEIAVYRPDGSLCAGSVVFTSTVNNVITVWGDDPLTSGEIEGMIPGEIMQWRIWDADLDMEYFAIATYENDFDGAYVPDGIHTVASLVPNGPTAVTLASAEVGDGQPMNALLLFLAGMVLITIIALKSKLRRTA